ncbi:3-ketosteroid 9alpha-monooxygenase subunit A [Amycolatopsis rubida]|uniref:3-ketosteroid 9alpha-monooxygenase subunit A n=1 Tax=Amycolatopsis rubida TaxID=112413 RepID=A0A1I5LBB1_9PSEU|nr:3-ketosteroid 9alpha-monooxygenase subunit A [Amycolatopsis rubida]
MIDELTYHYEGMDIDAVLIICHYPVTANSFKLQYGIVVKRTDQLSGAEGEETARKMGDFIRIGNPLLCEEDGPVYQLRRRYEQFHVDVADVTPEMTERFEFELDTAKPNAAWCEEVEENLGRRTGERV